MGKDERNKLIDGWRGVSVLLVIVAHLFHYRLGLADAIPPIRDVMGDPLLLAENLAKRLVPNLGGAGVNFFFVISGYLITSLLAAEEARNGAVSIRAFYVRRIFRIMPAFYLYLFTVLALRSGGMVLVNDDAFIRSGLYVCNLSGFGCSWWLAHTWSLSVEEQFYLCWPLAFVLLGHARLWSIHAIFIALVVGSFMFAELASFAYIAIGALVALSPSAKDWIAWVATTPVILFSVAVLLIEPLAFPVPILAKLLIAVKPILVALVFFGTLLNARGGPVRWLVSRRWLAEIGLFSYSLYLWQQLSLAPVAWNGQITGAEALYRNYPAIWGAAFIPAAILSYYLAERPLIKIGHRISTAILRRNAERAAADNATAT